MTEFVESGTVNLSQANSQRPSDITFYLPDVGEIICLKGNGDIYIKGKLVTNDMEVIEGMKEFFQMSNSLNNNWRESAKYFCDGMEYYRGLVEKIGLMLGDESFISDDGSVQQDVLCAKVPELVAQRLGIPIEQFEDIISKK